VVLGNLELTMDEKLDDSTYRGMQSAGVTSP